MTQCVKSPLSTDVNPVPVSQVNSTLNRPQFIKTFQASKIKRSFYNRHWVLHNGPTLPHSGTCVIIQLNKVNVSHGFAMLLLSQFSLSDKIYQIKSLSTKSIFLSRWLFFEKKKKVSAKIFFLKILKASFPLRLEGL